MANPLMPKATAVWLVDNTALSFDQIGEFCGLHPLEVKGIADGEVAQGIKGLDPIANSQLTRDQIEEAQENPELRLTVLKAKHVLPERKTRRGPRYTPLSRRQDRPDAIYWLIRNHPEISDAQVSKLVGTTKPTIQSIRDRTHWNASNLKPVDPVTLGLCSQIELDEVVQKAAAKKARAEERARKAAIKAGTIRPTDETLAPSEDAPPASDTVAELVRKPEETPVPAPNQDTGDGLLSQPVEKTEEPTYDADSVFASLNKLKDDEDQDSEK